MRYPGREWRLPFGALPSETDADLFMLSGNAEAARPEPIICQRLATGSIAQSTVGAAASTDTVYMREKR